MTDASALDERRPTRSPARRQPRRRKRLVSVPPAVVSGAPLRFEECRALGHEWKHRPEPLADEEMGFRGPPVGVDGGMGTRAYLSTCQGCGATRTKWIGRSGTTANRYRYPEGYQRRGEDERMSASEWRQAWVLHDLDLAG